MMIKIFVTEAKNIPIRHRSLNAIKNYLVL